jgi:hypothetical protein
MTRITLLFRALAVTMVAGSLTVSGCSCSGNDGQFPVDGGPDDSTVGMDATTPPDGEGGDGDGPDGSGGDGGETGNDGGTDADDGGELNPCDYDSGIICLGDGGLPDSGVIGCNFKPCLGAIYECGDCEDNDGDGFIDDEDPNCLGPCDNNEAGFDLKLPGQPPSPCDRDCYFDANSGSGNDKCDWALQCDPLTPIVGCCDPNISTVNCGHPNNRKTCRDPEVQDPLCHEICMPIVPNGCDCFGCCDIRTDANPGDENWIYIGTFRTEGGNKIDTCHMDAAKAGDHEACKPCTPQENCTNPCGICELCLGKTELPDICFPPPPPPPDAGVPDASEPPPPPPRCTGTRQPCGLPGDDPCPSGQFCLTGCCVAVG